MVHWQSSRHDEARQSYAKISGDKADEEPNAALAAEAAQLIKTGNE